MAERQTPTTPINQSIINDDGPYLRYVTPGELMNGMTYWRSREPPLGQRTTSHNNQPTAYSNPPLVRYVAPYDLMVGQAQFPDPPSMTNPNLRRHGDNINFLNSQSHQLAHSIIDLKANLGRYRAMAGEGGSGIMHPQMESVTESEVETIKQILKKDDSAASIYRRFKTSSVSRSSDFRFINEGVGIVATLATVENAEISRILSEYLGSGYMLAIVCNTLKGVEALEEYNSEGHIRCDIGLHGLGSAIGRNIDGRFTAIALENLSPFLGGFVPNDPQKKLAIPKPRMPNGECPEGFIDYAVNMIHLDHNHVSFVTAGGHGLRETLFYTLFARAQVYRTRMNLLRAMPCIHEGAVSLDGGLIKKTGMFAFGVSNDLDVKFPVIAGKYQVHPSLIEAEEMLRKLQWESTKLDEDMKREQQLLVHEANRETFP
ncbi:PREDICTED: protein DEFECTIVE IN MERISTEM SILENCING 3-like [Lupinus angustifolius]|uniref:protein DEFECTIVE IN MERISTEM SILENCING 3-like n=1 Tax=Lupinus angustifolius TaxID=3871 RepID=UPI00092F2728|nr:PREDICTED: protein DEFECTIVE IN MERISTEM SILENCING 3-like [Lupinus angustifolius]